MDELKIKSPALRGVVGRAVTRYLKKKGIDIEISINDIDGVTTADTGDVKVRADVIIEMSKAQLVRVLS